MLRVPALQAKAQHDEAPVRLHLLSRILEYSWPLSACPVRFLSP